MLYAANNFQRGLDGATTFGVLGPLPTPSILVEVKLILSANVTTLFEIGMVLSGTDSATLPNFNAGSSLIDRGAVISGLRPPQWIMENFDSIPMTVLLPVHILLTSGPQYVITHVNSTGLPAYSVIWSAVLNLLDPTQARKTQKANDQPQRAT